MTCFESICMHITTHKYNKFIENSSLRPPTSIYMHITTQIQQIYKELESKTFYINMHTYNVTAQSHY